MIKKIAHIALWIVLMAWFTVIMGFISRTNEGVLCNRIDISLSDSATIKFVTAKMVRASIASSGINTQGYPLEKIRTRELEQIIEKNPYVENAEVYINVEGAMMVDIKQRKPLMRIMPNGKDGFYIDQNGVILPLSKDYSPMVLLVTGSLKINKMNDEDGTLRIDLKTDHYLKDLIAFAKHVDNHPFWNKQIVQLYRSKNGDYEIIPRVGAHQIEFGTMDDYEVKLRNLKLLYDQGLKQYGWNSYNKINLKYSNQIICTKR